MTWTLAAPPKKPLPVLGNYVSGELLSSCLRRTAQIYEVSTGDLLIHFGITPPEPSRLIDFALPLPVQRRLSWCLRTNVQRIRNTCHPVSVTCARTFVAMAEAISRCSACDRKWRSDPENRPISRSWFESWRVSCGTCGRPFHLAPLGSAKIGSLPNVPDKLWQDSMAGSAIFARYLSGKPCGLLPPRLVWQLASAPLSGARGFRTGFGLMTPECLHPAFGFLHQSPTATILTKNLFKRLAMLAVLKRFNERPPAWIKVMADTATKAGEASISTLLQSLPVKIRNSLIPNAMPAQGLQYASHEVELHALRLKLAANLRQIDNLCLKLRPAALRHFAESRH